MLRIEDTDTERSTRESEQSILDDLRWLGLDWDEGPDAGGPYGPYRQSERMRLYRRRGAASCSRSGRAYRCFCTPDELEAERAGGAGRRPAAEIQRPLPRARSRRSSRDRLAARASRPRSAFACRRAATSRSTTSSAATSRSAREVIGDPVIVRSDGRPAYNFAVVVDDVRMEITHVVRGEDHISNTPRQILIYEALGADAAGVRAPLARARARTTRRCRSATARRAWRSSASAGYLPEALVNYLALLGWSPGENEELVPAAEMARAVRRLARSATAPRCSTPASWPG